MAFKVSEQMEEMVNSICRGRVGKALQQEFELLCARDLQHLGRRTPALAPQTPLNPCIEGQ